MILSINRQKSNSSLQSIVLIVNTFSDYTYAPYTNFQPEVVYIMYLCSVG